MRRPGMQLTHEVLVEEARFILRTLQREDLFGERVRLTEAERVLDTSISLSFADYCGFLNKYGYVRIDQLANLIEVTEGGAQVAQDLDDAEFHARLSRHFAKELSAVGSLPVRPLPRTEIAPSNRPTSPPAPPERSTPTTGEDVLDRRYRRGEIIGSGTTGTVYRGQHVSLARRMAIKEARSIFQFASYLRRDEIVRRLRTTIETHASIVHPNIVQIIDQNPEREFPYFVMELAEGGNLRQRMAAGTEGRLDLPFAVRVLLQLCYALRFAHARGVLHLGLKPENVLFDHLGNVKLSDFGFTRVTERTDDSSNTPVLVGGGTVGYMAPERLQPIFEAQVTPSADIYGLGVLFYEMITGKLPGRRSPLPSQARKDVPTTFDDVFDKMTRDELTERYAAIDDVLEGVYRAFPKQEVFTPGTILLYAEDPQPQPKAVAREEKPAAVAAPVPTTPVDSESKTGEIEIAENLSSAKPVKPPPGKRPPPPPPRK
jgi:serine/threonine protein kinase